jgi:lipoprotein signal peptidase
MARRSFRILVWALATFGVTADLASKYATFRVLGPGGRPGELEVVPGWFRLVAQFPEPGHAVPIETGWRGSLQALNGPVLPYVNKGALFGMGRGYEALANGFFAVVSLAAAVAILVWSTRPAATRDVVLCAALGLILGGTLGNLFDRVVFHGVRDFMYFYWINWPVFNFADCCLVAGAGLLLIQAMWPAKGSVAAPQEELAEVR